MAYGDGLQRNRFGVWYWRRVVPPALRDRLPLKEVSLSLGTTSRKAALPASLRLRIAASGLVKLAREGVTLSSEDMRAVLQLAREAVRKLESCGLLPV